MSPLEAARPSSEFPPIGGAKFAMVWRGYEPSEVNEYVTKLTDRAKGLEEKVSALESELEKVSALESELEEARAHSETPAASPANPYESVSDRVADVVRAFDQEVERMRREAEGEAERLVEEAAAEAEQRLHEVDTLRHEAEAEVGQKLADAQAEADRIRLDAQGNAEETLAKAERARKSAERGADKILGQLESRRESLVLEIRAIRERLLDSASDLESLVGSDESTDRVVVP
jgi:cell division septum initiation protein DivIVA